MRKEFSEMLHSEMSINEDIVLLTADLGYGLWDKIKIDYPDRFFDVGSSEQLMLGCACGMSLENKTPICYSITPFLLYRPFEWIRNYLSHEKINVKLAGGGRDRDYGYLGSSHWAEEDEIIMNQLKNIKTFKPKKLTQQIFKDFLKPGPCYINLKK